MFSIDDVSPRDARLVRLLRHQFYTGECCRGFGLRDEIEHPRWFPWGVDTPLGWWGPQAEAAAESEKKPALQSGRAAQ